MGIRFTCPNGHKLNVKSFLAGKRGICPRCGVGVDIPMESPPPRSDATASSPHSETPSPPAVSATDPEPGVSQVLEAAAPDPLAEAPNAAWYMRPNSGGQFGPASSDAMRAWISEGRVTRDSLVWREGWEDWRTAGEVFPSLAQTDSSPDSIDPPPASIVESPILAGQPLHLQAAEEANPAGRGAGRRRRQSTNYAFAAVVTLALAAIVLLAALIYVIVTQR